MKILFFLACFLIPSFALAEYPSRERLAQHWKQFKTLNKGHNNNKGLNFTPLFDLNMDASAIWSKLLICNNNRHDVAKKNYIQRKKICISADESTELGAEIAELHQNFQNYLLSGDLNSGKFNASIEHIYAGREFSFQEKIILHPLLVQTIIEYMAEFPIARFDLLIVPRGTLLMSGMMHREYRKAYLLLNLIQSRDCSSWGLDTNLNRQFLKGLGIFVYGGTARLRTGFNLDREIQRVCGKLGFEKLNFENSIKQLRISSRWHSNIKTRNNISILPLRIQRDGDSK